MIILKMCIPSIGDKILLTNEWTFTLYAESRNATLGEMFGHYDPVKRIWSDGRDNYGHKKNAKGFTDYRDRLMNRPICTITLPKDTQLTIDRIYIRKGATDFDSLSFWMGSIPPTIAYKKKGKVRFWAKLTEVNSIEFVMAN